MSRNLLPKSSVLGWALAAALVITSSAPTVAKEVPAFNRIVVFGDSLSDSGNAFLLRGTLSRPPYETLDALAIPDAPYARGGHHFSNGATWIEQFARPLAMARDVRPSLRNGRRNGANYAIGGARAYEDGKNVNLRAQVESFLADVGGTAPADGLYVIEFGGNDVRDALEALAAGGDPGAVLTASLESVGGAIGALYVAGARKFLVWNAPDLQLAPAIRALDAMYPGTRMAAGMLTQSFNASLDSVLASPGLSGLPGIEIRLFDVFAAVNEIAAAPKAYGLNVVDAACVTPGVRPFQCQEPDDYLFWDGIHPTRAVHGLLAHAVAVLMAQ